MQTVLKVFPAGPPGSPRPAAEFGGIAFPRVIACRLAAGLLTRASIEWGHCSTATRVVRGDKGECCARVSGLFPFYARSGAEQRTRA